MKFNTILFILFVPLILSIGIAPVLSFGDVDNSPSQNNGLKNYSPDTLLVKFKPNVSENYKNTLLKQNHAETTFIIPQIGVKILKVPEHNLDTILFALSHNPNVEFVEKDFFFEPSLIPNDSYYSNQWHLENIDADLAWDLTKGSSSIPIAILDTGIDVNHPDLADKLQSGYNFYDSNPDLTDVCGHGTKVAGSAAAISDNDLGVTGVAWNNPIIPIKITDSNCYGYYSSMTKGIIYAADLGARVANISFGIYGGNALNAATQYMNDQGGLVVAAGGNSGNYENYDANGDNPYLISVGATGSNDVKTSWSSYGEYIDFVAPGSGIYTTRDGGVYGSSSGTSFASPIVAGAIALIFSFDPTLTPDQVYDALKSSAVDLGESGRDNYYGWGKINVYGALQSLDIPAPIDDNTPPVISGMPLDIFIDTDVSADNVVTWTAPTADDNVGVVSFTSSPILGAMFPVGTTTVTYTALDAAGNSSTELFDVIITDNENPTITAPVDVTVFTDAGLSTATGVTLGTPTTADNVGVDSVTENSSEPYPLGITTVTWTALDAAGNSASTTQTVTVTDNENPTITALSNIQQATDVGSNTAAVTWTKPTADDNVGVASFTFTASPNDVFPLGTTTVTYTALDAAGNSSTESFDVIITDVIITDNENPTITAPVDVTVFTDAGLSIATGVTLGTPTTADNVGVDSVTENSSEPYPLGITTVTWTALDAAGNSASTTQTVTVTDNENPTITALNDVTVSTDAGSNTAAVTWTKPTADDNVGVTSFTFTASPDDVFPVGTTTVTYTATDAAGNSSESSFTITVNYTEPPVDETSPEVSITSHYDGQTIQRKTTISASASDASGISMVKFYVDGKLVSSDLSYPYNYVWNPNPLSSGLHVISVEAFDMYGNHSVDSINLQISKKGNSKN